MRTQGDVPENPVVTPRRVVGRRAVSSDAPGRKRELFLAWNRSDAERSPTDACAPVAGNASAGTIADPALRFPELELPTAGKPAIAYLVTALVFGATGFAFGLGLFGTVLAALLAYLGAGFVGVLGLGLLLFWLQR